MLISWSAEQRRVLEAPVSSRLLIEAGPGTGKTEVACGRIAWLIDNAGVLSHEILLISFTRTAIAELRARIEALAQNRDGVHGVRVSTIDSHAWALRHGFEEKEVKALGGDLTYQTNITRALGLLQQRGPQVLDFFAGLRHVIVDEAQDVVGERADFIVALLECLPEGCGATVFADPAQAIYGWTSDDDQQQTATVTRELLPILWEESSLGFNVDSLTHVYRTDNSKLLSTLARARAIVLDRNEEPDKKYEDAQREIEQFANGTGVRHVEDLLPCAPNSLILYRWRSEVVQQSGFLEEPFRLRMSNLPHCIEPWVGHLLCEQRGIVLTRRAYEALWEQRFRDDLYPRERDECWSLLRNIVADGVERISLRTLRRLLARPRPPLELCLPEFGMRGPILGTIHASKGREADSVILAVPKSTHPEANLEEESRVLYVGASRARRELTVARGHAQYASRHRDRVFKYWFEGYVKARVHIGLDGDLDTTEHATWEYAADTQKDLVALGNEFHKLTAISSDAWGWCFRLVAERVVNGVKKIVEVAQLTRQVSSELWDIGKRAASALGQLGDEAASRGLKFKPPTRIEGIKMLGLRTICVDEETNVSLRSPYAQSRMFLAPIFHGYPTVVFFQHWSRS